MYVSERGLKRETQHIFYEHQKGLSNLYAFFFFQGNEKGTEKRMG